MVAKKKTTKKGTKQSKKSKKIHPKDMIGKPVAEVEAYLELGKRDLATTPLSEDERELLSKADYTEFNKEVTQDYQDNVKPEMDKEEEEVEKEFDDIIDNEKDFLAFFNDDNLKFDIIYKRKLLKFEIRTIEKGEDLSFMDIDKMAFMELTSDEKRIYQKIQKNQELTEREADKIAELNKKQRSKAAEESFDILTQILAKFIIKPNISDSYQVRKEFWEKRELDLRLFVANEIMDRLGLSFGETVKLFQSS